MTTNEIMELADNYASLCVSSAVSDNLRLAETLEREARHSLQCVIEALQADAARYRWIKENHFQTGPDSWIRTGDDLEEAIDAAMK